MNPEIVAYIRANPHKFTCQEVADHFNVTVPRVSGLCTRNKIRNLINNGRISSGIGFRQQQEDSMEPKHVQRYRNFCKIWNDYRSYVAIYDLERALNLKDVWQLKRRYDKFRAGNPAFNLPELISRKAITGGFVPVPQSLLGELDRFRFTGDIKKGVVVTSAQFGAPLNPWFWKALNHYAKHRNFPLVVLPMKYGAVRTSKGKLTSTFPPELEGHVVLDDLTLHGKVTLNTVRMRPTLDRFLTDIICEMGGNTSQIFAAPKLELEFRPRIGKHYPKAVMTTGAVTHPNYSVDNLGQSDRTGELATKEHHFSAIVVEFDKDVFHFRQLLANKRGEFYDLGVFVNSQGVRKSEGEVEAIVYGDWHTGKTEPTVRKVSFEKGGITDTLKPKNVVLHDFFDGDSISHHGVHESTRSAYMGLLHWESLEAELDRSVAEMDWIHSKTDAKIHCIPSNHPEFVVEFINSLRWTKEKSNMYIGVTLFKMMVDDMRKREPLKVHSRATDPVALWFREKAPYAHIVERQETFVLPKGKNGILLSLHGDVGTRGAPTRGLKEFRKMNARVVLGHNHSGAIYGSIWRVGTSTYRMQFYVSNPATNWTNTHMVIYANGQRQLLNIIKGKWRGC